MLAGKSNSHSNAALALNGFARLPLTLLYIVMGIAIAGVYQLTPALQTAVAESGRLDSLVPYFILNYLPAGIRGLLVAAILAAAMSSLDSAINSLSAITTQDFISRTKVFDHIRPIVMGRIITMAWGVLIIGFALVTGHIAPTVIESINKAGSLFYGPVLAAFVTGFALPRVTANGIFFGILAGVGTNLWLWLGQAGIHWMWWNVTGFIITLTAAWVMAWVMSIRGREHGASMAPPQKPKKPGWRGIHTGLCVYFLGMIGLVLIGSGMRPEYAPSMEISAGQSKAGMTNS